eukprot:1133005-Rhodomonas_salina.2
MAFCGHDAQCLGDALSQNKQAIGTSDGVMAELLRLASGQVPFAKALDCKTTNCSVPAQYLEQLDTFGAHVPLLVICDTFSPPPARSTDAPWPGMLRHPTCLLRFATQGTDMACSAARVSRIHRFISSCSTASLSFVGDTLRDLPTHGQCNSCTDEAAQTGDLSA